MPQFQYPFSLPEEDGQDITGHLDLEATVSYSYKDQEPCAYRPGKLVIDGSKPLDLVLYHNKATSKFIYLREAPIDPYLLDIIGLQPEDVSNLVSLKLPGQLCMGPVRSTMIGKAIGSMLGAPNFKSFLSGFNQHDLAVFPIAREGLKYQVIEGIFDNFGYYCDEIVLDAHHVFSKTVPVYQRAVEFTLFKDGDLDQRQKENIKVAFIADSIASGLVMKEVIARIKTRFDHLQHVEIVAPLATIRGLCRIGLSEIANNVSVRVHVFETLLNALPPDYYYSAHINVPELHIRPDLDAVYRKWWGKDNQGKMISDTACAGYGWSEVFFSPRKQIEMINGELQSRHDMKIVDIIRRNIRQG